MQWIEGRQRTGYYKLPLIITRFFDLYLIKYEVGSLIPKHTDPVDNVKHYRLNIILRKPDAGGEFICHDTIFNYNRIIFFRPDINEHEVTKITAGVRYVLSLGFGI